MTASAYGVAQFDFQGENEEELSVQFEETVTIVEREVHEGWTKVLNYNGQQGLVPSAYLEIHEIDAYDCAEGAYDEAGAGSRLSQVTPVARSDPWDVPATPQTAQKASSWEQSVYDVPESEAAASPAARPPPPQQPQDAATKRLRRNSDAQSARELRDATLAALRGLPKIQGLKEYMMGELPQPKPMEGGGVVELHIDEEGNWSPLSGPYTCTLSDAVKQSKLGGLRGTVIYQVRASFSNVPVQRNEQHFEWLHTQLAEKFSCCATVPILPTTCPPRRVAGGSVDPEAVLQSRARRLQMWLNRVATHPLLSGSDAVNYFLTCVDEKVWKENKRRVEKDEARGAALLLLVTPQLHIDWTTVELNIEELEKYFRLSEKSVRDLNQIVNENVGKQQSLFRKQFLKMGKPFALVSKAFEQDPNKLHPQLTTAFRGTADAFKNCSNLMLEQHEREGDPFTDTFTDYTNHLACFPQMLGLRKGATQAARDSQRGILTGESVSEVIRDNGAVVNAAVGAEVNLYQEKFVPDFHNSIVAFLEAQIQLSKDIAQQMEQALQLFPEQKRIEA